jgi:hypothetical protein
MTRFANDFVVKALNLRRRTNRRQKRLPFSIRPKSRDGGRSSNRLASGRNEHIAWPIYFSKWRITMKAKTVIYGRIRGAGANPCPAGLAGFALLDPNVWSGRAVQEVFVDPG